MSGLFVACIVLLIATFVLYLRVRRLERLVVELYTLHPELVIR